MEQRVFGPTGVRVPVLGQGTWRMEEDDREGAIRALRLGLDLGMTHVDTAELYGYGEVEELVAEALEGRREAEDGPAGLLPVALAGAAPAGGDARGLRAADAGGRGPVGGGLPPGAGAAGAPGGVRAEDTGWRGFE
jgi:hypothetical protein